MAQILPEALFKEAKPVFSFWRRKGPICMGFKDIFIAIDEIHHGQGRRREPVLKPVNAVVTVYLEEDQENPRRCASLSHPLRSSPDEGRVISSLF